MDNLFMLLQKDKKLKRQFEILKSLSPKEIISAEKLSIDLNIHRATLTSDIESLDLVLPEGVTITQDFRKGYLLSFPENNSVDYYIAQIARNTLVYKIIDRLFLSVDVTITELADECYSSEPVILRLLVHMNKILKAYHISISKKKMKFVGREADIRTFLFAFYRTFMDYYTLEPIDDIYEHTYDTLVDEPNSSTLHQNEAKIFLWTVVSRIRISNEYFVSVDTDLQKTITEKKSYLDYKKQYFVNLKRLKEDYQLDGLKLPEAEVIWAYLVSLDCIEYVEKNEIDQTKSNLYRVERENKENQQLEIILYDIMTTHFGLTPDDMPQFKVIVAYLINIQLLSEISQNFQKVSFPLIRYIQGSYKDIYDSWCSILKTMPFNQTMFSNPEDSAVTLSMLTVPIVNSHSKGSLNILFSFESEAGFSSVLAEASKLVLVPGAHAMYVFSSAVTPQFIIENKIDVLVANFKQRHEDQLGCTVFHLSYLPTLTEWTQLRNKIITSLKQ